MALDLLVDPAELAASPPVEDLVVVLPDAANSGSIAELGGKGAALDRLIDAGLPVPATAVVLATASHLATTGRPLRTIVAALADGTSDLDDAAIDDAFAGAVDQELRAEILAERRRIAGDDPIAVRSSATAEDLKGASFAGQYRSIVGVASDDDVVAAVERVWASLWHHAPRTYRHALGIAPDAVRMAVVLQRMVAAERAGVVFTVDPEGRRGHLRLEHVQGLGEALVSGATTPAVLLQPRHQLDVELPRDLRSAAALSLRAEELFGGPQDVEWADDGVHTWIVQSRPITTVEGTPDDDGSETELRPDGRYTTAGIAEMLPGVLPPLRWSTAGVLVDAGLHQTVAALGSPSPGRSGWSFLVRVNGRAALDLDQLARVADDLPGGSPQELEVELFAGDAVTETASATSNGDRPPKRTLRDRFRSVQHDLHVLRLSRTAWAEHTLTVGAVDRVLASLPHFDERSDGALLALRARLVDLAARTVAAEVAIAVAAVGAYRRLEDDLSGRFGEADGRDWARRTTAGLTPPPLVRIASSVRVALEREVVIDPEMPWRDARRRLRDDGRDDLVALVRRAARRAGSRSVLGGPTWEDRLDRFWQLVTVAPTDPAMLDGRRARQEIEQLEQALVELPKWGRVRVLTGQVVDVRRRMVRRLASDAVELLERRDASKAAVLALGGAIRRLDDELGRRLAARRRLVLPTDVDLLDVGELISLVRDDRGPSPGTLVSRRRCLERWSSDPGLPLRFTGAPEAVAPPTPRGDRIDGWAASGGKHTGRVRVLTAPDAGAVKAGDVVVAERTDASWSPVFLRASAIIVEEGGPLSHAAIVAREFGLPAVVNVPGIVRRFTGTTTDSSGATVTVDGDHGTIVVHPERKPVRSRR